MNKKIVAALSILLGIGAFWAVVARDALGLTPQEQLGKFLFNDTNLSDPAGQSCAVCHDPTWDGRDLIRQSMQQGPYMRVLSLAGSGIENRPHPPMLVIVLFYTMMGPYGLAVCFGTDGQPAGLLATRWLSRLWVPS